MAATANHFRADVRVRARKQTEIHEQLRHEVEDGDGLGVFRAIRVVAVPCILFWAGVVALAFHLAG